MKVMFDGDEMNGMLLLDKESERIAEDLAPFTNIYDLRSLHSPSNIMSIPKPVVSNIANWLEEEREVNPEIAKRMTMFE